MEGESFESILKIVRNEPDTESSLNEDHRDFLESMLSEVKKGTIELEEAIKCADIDGLKKISLSFTEIFSMVSDSCE